ncbi:MAG TPA: hypothetical protein VHG08_06890 [Longimicrobium sp.]|nr:hypothetical protein [Longimicrobium sp.]
MGKLHLKLEELEVESFAVAEEKAERGTVQANQWSYDYNASCEADTCSGGMMCACGTWEVSYCDAC